VNRRVFLFGLPTAALSAYGYAYHVEPRWLDETRKTVDTGRQLRRPLRIAHLSDLHASETVPMAYLEEAFRRTVAMKPDVVCLTGDFVTTDTDFNPAKYTETLAILSSRCPVFAVTGNHDGGAWAAASGWFADSTYIRGILGRAGIRILQNEAATVHIAGQPLWLAGVGDWWSDELQAPAAFRNVSDDGAPVVVLNHNPDGKDDCAPFPWDLMLCGHTHGGQVIVPFYGPPIVPVLDTRYAVGLNAFGKRWIHTTRGVGNIRGFRANCRPELSLLEVR
jgi:uncharacterized protein